MNTRKINAIGLILVGAIFFAGGTSLFMTIYATVNEPTTISGIVGLSTIAFQPWLSGLLCLIGIILSIVGFVRLVANSPDNHPIRQ